METKQLVQASANVIRITHIAKGNIYKRFDTNYDYTYYGVVTDVLNDGTNTIITATEYKKSYNSIDVENRVLRNKNDYILFPATLEELTLEFDSAIKRKRDEIETYQEKILDNNKIIAITERLLSGEMQKELSTPQFRELTQTEFDERQLI